MVSCGTLGGALDNPSAARAGHGRHCAATRGRVPAPVFTDGLAGLSMCGSMWFARKNAMNLATIVLGTAAYTASTLTLAVLWHVVLFEERYRHFGYFEGEPSFALGTFSIVIQGVTLSLLYPHVRLGNNVSGVTHGLIYAFLIGLFFWTSHVLAFVAKQDVNDAGLFLTMESVYLILQFGIFGIAIGLIGLMGKSSEPPSPAMLEETGGTNDSINPRIMP